VIAHHRSEALGNPFAVFGQAPPPRGFDRHGLIGRRGTSDNVLALVLTDYEVLRACVGDHCMT